LYHLNLRRHYQESKINSRRSCQDPNIQSTVFAAPTLLLRLSLHQKEDADFGSLL